MDKLFRLAGARRRDPDVEAWFATSGDAVRNLARPWFDAMRACGSDVGEVMHDGCPTACVQGAAFGYVGAYRDHANLGFFFGAQLDDPAGLLEGSGKRMRHVKLRPGGPADARALGALIAAAYQDMRERLGSAG